MNLFDITGEDIAELDDSQLRELIGLLCEAELRAQKLSTEGVLWGGDQNAKDGGIDVSLECKEFIGGGFLPRSVIGFQVKKPDMSPSKIPQEMHSGDEVRKEIQDLISREGAYIIASSGSKTSKVMLSSRKKAMRNAVSHIPGHEKLHLDYYDRNRIASWARLHAGVVIWVRSKIHRNLDGWKPYENWANPKGGLEEEYIIDQDLRLSSPSYHDSILPLVGGMQLLQEKLSKPKKSIRLVGLSGVGKTRFVQALFDQRVTNTFLDPGHVVYTDMGLGPIPNPTSMAEQLIADHSRAILIIDNCSPELHNRLTEICNKPKSKLSLLTVEYDIRQSLSDETEFFRLEPASEEVIEKLLEKRFDYINRVDARTIANVSGGNARIAIAIASMVRNGESLTGFSDEELFKRLFWQKDQPNEDLLRSAEACALVYSFDGEDDTSKTSELAFLASFAEISIRRLFKDVEVLRSRDLIQSRSKWRAVLPQAIANRLAVSALQKNPISVFEDFCRQSPKRLLVSFTRRLSFLHEDPKAVRIATDWISKDGWLRKRMKGLDNDEVKILTNLAPVVPGAMLSFIEDSGIDLPNFYQQRYYRRDFLRILRHLSYEPVLFQRSINQILRFARHESEDGHNTAKDVFKSLFTIYLSGTHASIEQRTGFARKLLNSTDSVDVELGKLALGAMLGVGHFTSHYPFEFGARSRDYGLHPSGKREIQHWYREALNLCRDFIFLDSDLAGDIRKFLEQSAPHLWSRIHMYDDLEEIFETLHSGTTYHGSWVVVRSILRFHKKRTEPEALKRVKVLEKKLHPTDILQETRAFLLSGSRSHFYLEDNEDSNHSDRWRRTEESIFQLGVGLAKDNTALLHLLPEIITSTNQLLPKLGSGLAEGSNCSWDLWKVLRNAFQEVEQNNRQIWIFKGFLNQCAETDTETYNKFLDYALGDEVLQPWFPHLQASAAIDLRGLARIHQSLDRDLSPVKAYGSLVYERAYSSLSDDDLADIVSKILNKDQSLSTVSDLLWFRFYDKRAKPPQVSPKLLEAGRRLLTKLEFTGEDFYEVADHHVDVIAESCLEGTKGEKTASILCNNIIKGVKHHIGTYGLSGLLKLIAKYQPVIFLNCFIEKARDRWWSFESEFSTEGNPLNEIEDKVIIHWCDINPSQRYLLLAECLDLIIANGNSVKWKTITFNILQKAPSLDEVLNLMGRQVRPSFIMGSRADVYQNRIVLFKTLQDFENLKVAKWAVDEYASLLEDIESCRHSENERSKRKYESFE